MSKFEYAFLVHSRDRSDLPRKFPFLKILPNFVFDFISKNLPPIVVSKITGLTTIENKESLGIIIGIPMTAHQLIENRELALKRILQAVNIAKSKGVRFVGLGAMTASLSRGGLDVIEKIPEVSVTTGRTYTVKNIVDYVDYCVDKFNLDKGKITIGVVGAAGGIGSGVTLALVKKEFKKFILIDLERKADHLRKHIDKITDSEDLSIEISHKISSVSLCDIVVAATNAPEVLIKSEDLTQGTIVINDAQPSDISPEILKTRDDVLVIEGGVLHTENINCNFNLGLFDHNDIFSCLAETILLTYRNIPKHYSMGDLDHELFGNLTIDSEKLKFKITKPQNSKGYVSDDFIDKFAKIIKTRQIEK